MNLDLLLKLARLATNNPNEHEAALASKKACELLAEDNFKWLIDLMKPNQVPFQQPATPYDIYEQMRQRAYQRAQPFATAWWYTTSNETNPQQRTYTVQCSVCRGEFIITESVHENNKSVTCIHCGAKLTRD